MTLQARTCPVCDQQWTPTKDTYRNQTCGQACGSSLGSGAHRWTPDQVKRLRSIYAQYRSPRPIPIAEVAALIGRTPQAVRGMAHKLGLSDPTRIRGNRRGQRQSHHGMREDLGIYVRSSWEANYGRWLNYLIEHGSVVSWEYEPKTFEFPVKRGNRTYTPDFLVRYTDRYEWHELKGWMSDDSRVKLDRFKRYYPDEPLVLIDADAYRAIAQTARLLIPRWETPSRSD